MPSKNTVSFQHIVYDLLEGSHRIPSEGPTFLFQNIEEFYELNIRYKKTGIYDNERLSGIKENIKRQLESYGYRVPGTGASIKKAEITGKCPLQCNMVDILEQTCPELVNRNNKYGTSNTWGGLRYFKEYYDKDDIRSEKLEEIFKKEKITADKAKTARTIYAAHFYIHAIGEISSAFEFLKDLSETTDWLDKADHLCPNEPLINHAKEKLSNLIMLALIEEGTKEEKKNSRAPIFIISGLAIALWAAYSSNTKNHPYNHKSPTFPSQTTQKSSQNEIMFLGRVIAPQELNVRSGPSTQFGVVKKIHGGDLVPVYKTENGWVYIGVGWINSKFVTDAEAEGE